MNHNNKEQRGPFASIIGELTPAKRSGLTFTLAALAPLLLAFAFMAVLLVTGLSAQEGVEQSDWYLYLNYLMVPLSFACIAWGLLRLQKMPIGQAVKAQTCQPKYYLIALLMQFGLLSLAELNTLFLTFLEGFGYQASPILLPSMDGFGIVGVLLVIAVLPAVFEEVIFRGFLLKGMKAFGTLGAVLLCGGLFALYHQNPAQTVYQFCCGAAFALVAVKAGSVLPTILSHFLNNAYIVIMTKLGITAFPTPVYITLLILEIISLVAAMVCLLLDKKPENGDLDKTEKRTFWTFALPGIAYCALAWISVFFAGVV